MLFLGLTGPAFGQGAGDALMRLLKSGKLPPERLPAVVEMVGRRGDAADLGYLFEQVTRDDGWDGETAVTALEGLAAAAENRKLKPQGDLTRLRVLFEPDRPADVKALAVRLAGLWQVPELAEPLQDIVRSPESTAPARAAALQALAGYGEQGRRTIESLAAATGPLTVRSGAIDALAGLDLKAAATHAADALAAAKPEDDVAPVLATFLGRQGGPDALAAALGDVKLPPEIAGAALRSMYSVGRSDGALSAAFGQAAGIAMEDKPPSAEELKQLVDSVVSEGDAERGQLVFRRGDLSCLKCHAVSGAGGNIGPDLSGIGPSNPLDYLVQAILDPDAAVKEHYATQVVITSEGLIVTGIVADENDDRLVLRTAEGVDRSVPKADIELREQGDSLMPRGLVKFMTRQEFVDLVRFLAELGKPGTPYAIRSTPTIQRWRHLGSLPENLVGEVPGEAAFREALPSLDSPAWEPFYARVDGTLPLAELVGNPNEPVYLLAEIDVRTGGSVGLRIDDVDGLDLWINGDHLDSVSREFVTEFTEGRQTFVLRIDPAERETETLHVELFTPDGSTALAEPVGGI